MRRHHGGVRRANRVGGSRFPRLPGGVGGSGGGEAACRRHPRARRCGPPDACGTELRSGRCSGWACSSGCWGGPEMAVREAQDEAPIARTLPSHTRSDNRFPGVCDCSLMCSPSIRPGSSTRTTSFDLHGGHPHRGHVGPGVLAHTDRHVVQRLMRAVLVGGRDLTDQLAIAS